MNRTMQVNCILFKLQINFTSGFRWIWMSLAACFKLFAILYMYVHYNQYQHHYQFHVKSIF